MATLNGVDIGHVQTEDQTKSANLDEFPIPLENSNKTQAWDYAGVVRTIRINGKYAAAAIATLRTFVTNMEGIINGDQSTPVTYASDFTGGNFDVKMKSFRWTYDEGIPLAITYTIELVEAEL